MGGRSGSAKHLHFQSRSRRRWPRRLLIAAVLIGVVGLAGAVARAATLKVPGPRVAASLPATVPVPGTAPVIAWPAAGQAAAEVRDTSGAAGSEASATRSGPAAVALGSSGPTTPAPVASLAKVMTAYVVLQDHPLAPGQPGFTVTVGAADVADYSRRQSAGELVTPVVAGEQLTEKQLLEALLVASGNNMAPLLAAFDAGTPAAFVAKMNVAAHSIGMAHTTYTDPSGVDPATASTASDQLLLADRAMADPEFAAVVGQTSVSLPVAGTVANSDRLVGQNGFVGIKSGSDAPAGGCVMFAAQRVVAGHGVLVIGVLLGQGAGQTGTRALSAAAASAAGGLVGSLSTALAIQTVLPAGTTAAYVTGADGHRVAARTAAALQVLGWPGMAVPVQVSVRKLGAAVRSGQTVAQASLSSDPQHAIPVRVSGPVGAPGWSWRLHHLF